MRYRAKPVEIEAVLFLGPFSYDEICEKWDGFGKVAYMVNGFLQIRTPEGEMGATVGDYIIKGTHGEFYPCKSDVFQYKYEPAPVQSVCGGCGKPITPTQDLIREWHKGCARLPDDLRN